MSSHHHRAPKTPNGGPRSGASSRHMLTAAVAGAILLVTTSVMAQNWTWPWETETRQQERPRREFRQPPPRVVPRQPQQTFDTAEPGDQPSICLQLERRLANEVNGGRNRGQTREDLAARVRELSSQVRRRESTLERRDCWDEFFFQRTLRNTRACVSQYRALQTERQQLQDARAAYDGLSANNSRALQQDLINELARNGCGAAYQQEARRQRRNDSPFASFFQDDSRYDTGRGNTYRGLPFATYRTLCVRLCDGFYFPVSFSTLPNYFERDSDVCQSKCAAPTSLYYHQNPGGSIDQMVSATDNSAYRDLTTAFQYRKTFTRGCSCKASEYIPDGIATDERAETAQQQPRLFSPVR
ncbi:MAG: DUF2865 domain-containing protein [Pseudomonadota bacterium]